jgi:hypothetical protein
MGSLRNPLCQLSTLPRKHQQVLGAGLNRSESVHSGGRRHYRCPFTLRIARRSVMNTKYKMGGEREIAKFQFDL